MVNYTFVLNEILTEMFRRVGLVFNIEYCRKEGWYLTKSWTQAEQDDFKRWGEKVLRSKLKITRYAAETEMGWFLLSHGWTIRREHEDKN